jgi:hypothetical protein
MDSRELRFRAVGLLGWGVLGAYFPWSDAPGWERSTSSSSDAGVNR